MSDTNRIQLGYIAEPAGSFAGAVSGSPLKLMRITGESLAQANNMVTSNEIRADRQTADVVRVGLSAAGDFNFELSAGAHDDFLQYSLCSGAWSSVVTVTAATISAASGDNSFNDSGSGLAGMSANQWIRASGFANSANNGFFKITSVAAGKIIVRGGTLVTEASGSSRTLKMGAQIVNGTTLTTMNIERKYADLTSILSLFTGMAVNTLNLSVASSQIITGSAGFMGKTEASIAASNGSGYTAAPTNDVMSATDNVTAILENYAQYDSTQFSISLNNNLRDRLQIATLGPKSIGMGEVGLTGTVQAYFASTAVMDKYLGNTPSALAIGFLDGNSSGYLFDCPRVKYTAGRRVAGGKNTDIIADMAWTAYREPTELVTLRIARF
jgi:hypothetical protein